MANDIMDTPLGVVFLDFKPAGAAAKIDLGKTTDATKILTEEDLKDIIYQQTGTKPFTKIRTGVSYMVQSVLGNPGLEILGAVNPNLKPSGSFISLNFSRELFKDLQDEAGELTVTRMINGTRSTNPKDIIIFPSAAPRMTTEIGWGADLQRTVGVEWWIFVNESNESFGYSGYASSLGL